MRNRLSSLSGPLFLVLASFIWGVAFVAQKAGMDHVGPYAFTVGRSVLGVAFLACVLAVLRRPLARDAVRAGIPCGLALFVAMQLQQVGLQYTTAGISAFLTANYVLLVPLFGLALGARAGIHVWLCAALALAGLYLICNAGGAFRPGPGELLTLLCAASFAVQILMLGHWARRTDPVALTLVEFAVSAVCALPFALLLPGERAMLSASSLRAAFPAFAYVGLLSSGVAYTFQTAGQARTPPALAAILMSLESVFGALAGWLVLSERLTRAQAAGCALVFAAVVLSQVWESLRGRRAA